MPRYGVTAIRIVHRNQDMDFEPIVERLSAMPGVEAAAVVWQNEAMDESDAELLEQAQAQRRANGSLKRRLTR